MAATLRLRARGASLVQDHEALVEGVRRFIGRKLVEIEPAQGDKPARHAWIDSGETVQKPATADYLHDLKHNALWPADEATAKLAGVPFDPTFGGEEQADASEGKKD